MTHYSPDDPARPEERPKRPVVQNVNVPPAEPHHHVPVPADQFLLERVVRLVYFGFGVLEAGLLLRFLLKLIGANPGNPFAILIYGLTEPFTFLFSTLVNNPAAGGFVVEVTTLIAMLFYWLLAWGIVRFLWLMFSRRPA